MSIVPGNLDRLETKLTTVVGTFALIFLAVTLKLSFEVPLTLAEGSPQFFRHVLCEPNQIKLVHCSEELREPRRPISCCVIQAAKGLLSRGFPYLEDAK